MGQQPPLKGARSQRSPFMGFPSIYNYTLCRRTAKFDMATRVGGAYHGVVHASHHERAEFQPSPLFEALVYLCLQPLTQNDQIGQW